MPSESYTRGGKVIANVRQRSHDVDAHPPVEWNKAQRGVTTDLPQPSRDERKRGGKSQFGSGDSS